jgi:hypothetical protein
LPIEPPKSSIQAEKSSKKISTKWSKSSPISRSDSLKNEIKPRQKKEKEQSDKDRVKRYLKRYPVDCLDLRQTQVITWGQKEAETSSGGSSERIEEKKQMKTF